MIRTLLWKEWREHRAKYAFYWLVLNAPVLLLAAALAISTNMRTPFAGLSNATILQYLPIALAEPFLVTNLFLLATALLAIATFLPEIEDRTLLFVYEQPVPRKRYVALKLAIGGAQVAIAVSFAILFAIFVTYALMLASGKVTAAGSAAGFHAVFAAALRSAVWCSVISLMIFTGAALVSALAPRWWVAAVGSLALIVALLWAGGDFFSYVSQMLNDSETMNMSMNFGTGNWQWVTISRPFHPSELGEFAPWRGLPLLVASLITAGFSLAAAQVYSRKEIR